jgi:hypothetical protein
VQRCPTSTRSPAARDRTNSLPEIEEPLLVPVLCDSFYNLTKVSERGEERMLASESIDFRGTASEMNE